MRLLVVGRTVHGSATHGIPHFCAEALLLQFHWLDAVLCLLAISCLVLLALSCLLQLGGEGSNHMRAHGEALQPAAQAGAALPRRSSASVAADSELLLSMSPSQLTASLSGPELLFSLPL